MVTATATTALVAEDAAPTRLSAATVPEVLSEDDRHLVSRFSFGLDEGVVTDARAAGGGLAWLTAQLAPGTIDDPDVVGIQNWWTLLKQTPATAWRQVDSGRRTISEYGESFAQYSLAYKVLTRRQTQEVMHDFWSNLLYVPVGHSRSFPWRLHYDRTLRPLALTSYRQLLRAAVTHPAVSGWLNNDLNAADKINENLGRELLELYTIGRATGYTEDDVKSAARLLTGFTVDVFGTFAHGYDPARHATGPVQVLDFSHENADPDGRPALYALLDHLALHPATAERVARRLCERLVGEPSDSLVAKVKAAYLSSGSAVKPVLRALRTHPDFLDSQRSQLQSPVEDVVSTVRALGLRPAPFSTSAPFAAHLNYACSRLGQPPYRWPRPDGFPEDRGAWASPSRMTGGWNVHHGYASRWSDDDGLRRPQPADVLPTEFPRTLGELIEHQSRVLLGRPAKAEEMTVVTSLLGKPADLTFATVDAVSTWHLTVIRSSLINSPEGVLR